MTFREDYIQGKVSLSGYSQYEESGLTKAEEKEVKENPSSLEKIMREYRILRIEELTNLLNQASEAYYSNDYLIMPDYQYDKFYDELLSLESRTGFSYENSPTRRVGYEVKSSLQKETHEFKALSLDKTKDREALKSWLNNQEGVLSWKLDGLTVQLTYDGGVLTKAVTRGNGEVGENITHNAKFFGGVPKTISYPGHLVVRGEALISYEEFERINQSLPDEKKYKNPRNLASGSVRQLDAKEAARRHIQVKAFELIFVDNSVTLLTYETRFKWLKAQGFDVVEFYKVKADTLFDRMEQMEKAIPSNPFPSDGLVLAYNDVAYGKSLGSTGKFPKHSIAFKWKDETQETTIREIEWSPSRTGLLNPVAVFDPIELEGTTVTRASVHNVSIVEGLQLGIGDQVTVYKANMIIPQIAENLTKSGSAEIPKICPACGKPTEIKEVSNHGQLIKTLYCINPDCPAKHVGKFVHFAERDRMNIVGLSEATLEKFIGKGFVREYSDLYHLDQHKDEIIAMEGQGEKSYEKLRKAIEKSRKVKLENLIAAMGIPNVGRDAGKKISRFLGGDLEKWNEKLESGEFQDVEDIGEISNLSIQEWYQNEKNRKEYFDLLKELEMEKPIKEEKESGKDLSGKTFVITGDLVTYKNRAELTAVIERLGGKVTGSVSKKTSYLINNDVLSNSSKNKKAKGLGIPILSEEDFKKMIESN